MLAAFVVADPAQIDRAPHPGLARDAHVVLGRDPVALGEALPAAGLHRMHEVIDLVHALQRGHQRGRVVEVGLDRQRSIGLAQAARVAHQTPERAGLAQRRQQLAADEARRAGQQDRGALAAFTGRGHALEPSWPRSRLDGTVEPARAGGEFRVSGSRVNRSGRARVTLLDDLGASRRCGHLAFMRHAMRVLVIIALSGAALPG